MITPKLHITGGDLATVLRTSAQILTSLGLQIPANRYRLQLSDIYTMISSNPTYQRIKAPITLDSRYLWEDIPTGLVPISSFGDALGVPTKAIDHLIDEGCETLKRNFWEEGRTLEKLGLSKENLLSELKSIIGHRQMGA